MKNSGELELAKVVLSRQIFFSRIEIKNRWKNGVTIQNTLGM